MLDQCCMVLKCLSLNVPRPVNNFFLLCLAEDYTLLLQACMKPVSYLRYSVIRIRFF